MTYIMKSTLFLFALVLSLHGWCASVAPSQPTAGAISLSHQTTEKGNLEEGTNSPLLVKAVMIGSGLLIYLIVICWWAITAKNSLDKILKNVLQDIARCQS
jgi:hypothetical protein